jgi:LuxR family maltose regulon positive regulatory protein
MTDSLHPAAGAVPAEGSPQAGQFFDRIKFHPPRSSRGGIERAPLLARLEQDTNAHLILLLAPAGYGKTTLMGQWMERIRRADGYASWLTLDESNNDPAQLMSDLYGALRDAMEASLGPNTARMPVSSDHWLALLERMGPDAPQHTLFLDEFEKISAEPALQVARLLANRLPRKLRLVISSRDKPALGLERFRVRGELLELTAGELRFDLGETQRFFGGRMAAPLSNVLVEKLQGITGGWPAALQLTALAARNPDDLERYAADLSGSLTHIADYLAEDVLQAQPPAVRTFLLETCHFPRLCPAVCDTATGRSDSARMLQYLERHGLFTVLLDVGQSWYRYHPLFAQFLQTQQAQVLSPERVEATHRGAARWFARHGGSVEAVDLWLLAGDTAAALREMAACAREMVMQAQFGTIARWIERLDEDGLAAAGPELLLAAAWACAFMGDTAAAANWLARLMPLVAERHAVSLADPQTRQRPAYPLNDDLMALEPILLAMSGDTGSALERGLAHWQVIGPGHRFAVGALTNVISYCLMLDGQFERASQFSAEARACNDAIGSALGLGYALSVAGLIEAMQGNLASALERFYAVDKMAVPRLKQPWFEATHVKIASIGLIASVLYETGRLDEADELLQRYLPLMMQQPSMDMLLLCHLIFARVKLTRGDADGAHELLNSADRRIASFSQFARARHVLESERIRVALVCGDTAGALLRAESLERIQNGAQAYPGNSFVEELFGAGIETARLAIARGAPRQALVLLDHAVESARAGGRRWRLLKLLLLRALAHDACGAAGDGLHVESVRDDLCAALVLGHQIGARRSFTDEGPRLIALLAQLPAQAIAQDDKPPAAAGSPNPGAATAQLSDRERAILRLLATGMANEQVAATVFLSVNTVKWHIRRILEKLSARNRSEAVFIARQQGLIDP